MDEAEKRRQAQQVAASEAVVKGNLKPGEQFGLDAAREKALRERERKPQTNR